MLLVAGFIAALAVGQPALINARISREAAHLALDDRPLEPGLDARILRDLAVLEVAESKPHPPGCNSFCLLMLTSGAADQIILATLPSGATVADPPVDRPATAWRLERRPTCPPVQTTNWGEIDRPWGAENLDGAMWSLILQAGEANGLCLLSAEARLSDAATLLVLGWVDPMASDWTLAHRLWADAVGAKRLALYLRDGAGWRTVLRETGVTQARLQHHFPVPGFLPFGGQGSLLAWPRQRITATPPGWGDAGPGFGAGALLWGDLGLDTRTGPALATRLAALLPLPDDPTRRALARQVLDQTFFRAFDHGTEPPELVSLFDRILRDGLLADDPALLRDLQKALSRRP